MQLVNKEENTPPQILQFKCIIIIFIGLQSY